MVAISIYRNMRRGGDKRSSGQTKPSFVQLFDNFSACCLSWFILWPRFSSPFHNPYCCWPGEQFCSMISMAFWRPNKRSRSCIKSSFAILVRYTNPKRSLPRQRKSSFHFSVCVSLEDMNWTMWWSRRRSLEVVRSRKKRYVISWGRGGEVMMKRDENEKNYFIDKKLMRSWQSISFFYSFQINWLSLVTLFVLFFNSSSCLLLF